MKINNIIKITTYIRHLYNKYIYYYFYLTTLNLNIFGVMS